MYGRFEIGWQGSMTAQRPTGSVDKAVLALQRLSEVGPDGCPLNRLAVDLGINKASLHHTLSILRQRPDRRHIGDVTGGDKTGY